MIAPQPVAAPSPKVVIRRAGMGDLSALVRLENATFTEDRLSRRSFRHLLARDTAACPVAEIDGGLVGYALVLFRRGTSLARLYSIATLPSLRGRGIGLALLRAAEAAAIERDALHLRLEVRPDNAAAIALYRRHGYQLFGRFLDYYEDHAQALRFEKRLLPDLPPRPFKVPYYPQSTDFTCGPAALMMAMKALDPAVPLDPGQELRLWRESTTVFMTSGHGGADPYGLALAAHRRGFAAEVRVSRTGPLFLDGVRSEAKRRIMRLAHDTIRADLQATDVRIVERPLELGELCQRLDAGAYPIVLISAWRMYHEKGPHWVVVTDHDARFLFVHDPWVDEDDVHDSAAAKANIPVPREELMRMARYGRDQLRAAVVIGRRERP
jgi:ribosomal protein S18 acetylase RimI-like enzyme